MVKQTALVFSNSDTCWCGSSVLHSLTSNFYIFIFHMVHFAKFCVNCAFNLCLRKRKSPFIRWLYFCWTNLCYSLHQCHGHVNTLRWYTEGGTVIMLTHLHCNEFCNVGKQQGCQQTVYQVQAWSSRLWIWQHKKIIMFTAYAATECHHKTEGYWANRNAHGNITLIRERG